MKAFFIVGVQRSGTTLLSVMLGKHPDVLMERRSIAFRIVTCFKNLFEILPHNLEVEDPELLDWLIQNDGDGRLNKLLSQRNHQDNQSIRELLEYAIDQNLQVQGKKIWGDKSPNLQHFLPELLTLMPDAKILHIVRDGRATANSMVRRTSRHLLLSAQEWVDGNISGLVNQQMIGTKNYHLLSFEDLIEQPAQTMRKVCGFLEIPFSAELLNLQDAEVPDDHKYVRTHFDKKKLEEWKAQLSQREIQKIEEIQGPLLKRFGYSLIHESEKLRHRPLSVWRRIRYNQWDNIKQLFISHKIGMINREQVEMKISLKSRFYHFIRILTKDLLAFPIFKSLFSRIFYKEKFYKPTTPKKEKNQKV